MPRRPESEVDDEFRSFGLEPLAPFAGPRRERACRCQTCGTTRWVRLANLRRPGSVACRWCHGWGKWTPWGEHARVRAATWRNIVGPETVAEKLAAAHLVAITPIGDECTPVGVRCVRCDETTVVMPERIVVERGWNACQRCAQERRAKVTADAPDVFAAAGLRLLGPCRGEFVPQAAECLECGSRRAVSYRRIVDGTAPLCWACTFGIRPNEPHRVYLLHRPRLGVYKVGLTHARHDRRLYDHELEGGTIIDTVTVPDRATARVLERRILDQYAPWRAANVGPSDFPQGGWTETWLDDEDAPRCDLAALASS